MAFILTKRPGNAVCIVSCLAAVRRKEGPTDARRKSDPLQ